MMVRGLLVYFSVRLHVTAKWELYLLRYAHFNKKMNQGFVDNCDNSIQFQMLSTNIQIKLAKF